MSFKPKTYKDAYIELRGKYETLYNQKVKPKREFSKSVMIAVMATYFIGLFFGMYAVNKILTEYPEWAVQAAISMFGYIDAPVSVAIGFYSWKAKNENTAKIDRGTAKDDTEEESLK